MTVVTTPMKTHSRKNITTDFLFIHDCKIHNCKPSVWDIVSGKMKEHYYLVHCDGSDDCGKLSMDSPEHVVDVWNHYNPIKQNP